MDKRKLHLFLRAAILASLSLGYVNAHADVKTEVQGEVKTVDGVLQVLREIKDGDQFQYVVILRGKVLVEKDSQIKKIKSVYPSNAAAKLILLEIDTGGSGCPLLYRVVEIKTDGHANVTDEFGTCGDLTKISFENDAWRIDFPRFGGAPASTWVYRDGKLIEVKRKNKSSAPKSKK